MFNTRVNVYFQGNRKCSFLSGCACLYLYWLTRFICFEKIKWWWWWWWVSYLLLHVSTFCQQLNRHSCFNSHFLALLFNTTDLQPQHESCHQAGTGQTTLDVIGSKWSYTLKWCKPNNDDDDDDDLLYYAAVGFEVAIAILAT